MELQGGVSHQFTTGYLRDGKLVQVERWIAQVDGSGSFAWDILYPESKKFADPDTIGKIDYASVKQPYLARKIHTCADMTSNHEFCISSLQSVSLQDAWKDDNRLILLGDAGQGKSIKM